MPAGACCSARTKLNPREPHPQLGMKVAATLLNQTLEQEYNPDRTLTELAESSLNRQAAA
jgi:ferritin-like metal-binding protein YciE